MNNIVYQNMKTSSMPFLVLYVLIFLFGSCESLMFNVEPNEQVCFYQDISEKGTRLHSEYQVQRGGFLDIDFKITGPSDEIVYDGMRESSGRYTFHAYAEGSYRFCFGNKMSTVTEKTVNFDLEVGHEKLSSENIAQECQNVVIGHPPATLVQSPHFGLPTDLDPIEKSIGKLEDEIRGIQYEQRTYRNRERTHRNTSEDTNTRIMFWSVTILIVLVGIAVWQIFYLRRFFEVKRAV